MIDRDRESQLSGWLARVQQGRKNINGSGVVILVALKTGKLFGAIMTSLGSWRIEFRANDGEQCLQKSHDPILIRGLVNFG